MVFQMYRVASVMKRLHLKALNDVYFVFCILKQPVCVRSANYRSFLFVETNTLHAQ
jgi:hypothetical protein